MGSWGVATPHEAASRAAAEVLASGGTAVDGALAAAGVLTVVYPHNCSLGGDLIALVRQAGQDPQAVFGVGRSASALDAEALRRQVGEQMPVAGPLSISVPGVVSGWQALHELGGSLPIAHLLQPAITLASNGAPVAPSLGRALEVLDSDDPGLEMVFGPPGNRVETGRVFVQPQLAATLAEVASDPDSYYRGGVARRLARALELVGSPITIEDFSRHAAVVEEAAETNAGLLAPRLMTAGLPSQGVFFAALAAVLGKLVADGYDLLHQDAAVLGRAFKEIARLRDELLCDPSRFPEKQSIGARLSAIDLFESQSSAGRLQQLTGDRAAPPSGDTVAVVVSDAAGNSVSMLQSVFHSFGSKILDPVTGVLFHNRQSMFTLRPDAPGELGPGLMPPHTLCPIMVDGADGSPLLVVATMGGRAQPQILAQVLLQLAAGSDAVQAVSAPRLVVGDPETGGSHWVVTAERDVPEPAVRSLAHDGFDVNTVGPLSEDAGHAQLLRVSQTGVFDAASDPRADGMAVSAGL